jgi:hypothetical protein
LNIPRADRVTGTWFLTVRAVRSALRSSLDGPTSQLVVGSVHKDLASAKEAELMEHLSKVIAI